MGAEVIKAGWAAGCIRAWWRSGGRRRSRCTTAAAIVQLYAHLHLMHSLRSCCLGLDGAHTHGSAMHSMHLLVALALAAGRPAVWCMCCSANLAAGAGASKLELAAASWSLVLAAAPFASMSAAASKALQLHAQPSSSSSSLAQREDGFHAGGYQQPAQLCHGHAAGCSFAPF